MELEHQERERDDKSLYNFKVDSSSQFPIESVHALHKQYWIVISNEQKNAAIDGIGPFRLVRNSMPYASYP